MIQHPGMRRALAPGLLASVLLAPVGRADMTQIEGLYEITVALEIPNVETRDYDFSRMLCLDPDRLRVLGPLGPGPLGTCPREVRQTPTGFHVLVRCEGPNTAWARGIYEPTLDGFRGTVSMNMGGKNMTLVERQRAVRLGACDAVE
ncbi:MAG: hypothetical protein AAF501_19640 [Pseudomonadota bacterium]